MSGNRRRNAAYAGATRGACVCWSISSETRTRYGSRERRHGYASRRGSNHARRARLDLTSAAGRGVPGIGRALEARLLVLRHVARRRPEGRVDLLEDVGGEGGRLALLPAERPSDRRGRDLDRLLEDRPIHVTRHALNPHPGGLIRVDVGTGYPTAPRRPSVAQSGSIRWTSPSTREGRPVHDSVASAQRIAVNSPATPAVATGCGSHGRHRCPTHGRRVASVS